MEKTEFTVEITAEITYCVKILASDEDEAMIQAKDNYYGPITITLKDRNETYEGTLQRPWAWCDLHLVEKED